MKIGVLGAGISGLSIGKMLKERFDVEILERDREYGGIAKTKQAEGVTYHKIGGHCFNSKHQDVLDFVFKEVLDRTKWHLIKRDAVIRLEQNEVSYPIEFSVRQIYEFNPELAIKIAAEFLQDRGDNDAVNLEEWFRHQFGNTLSELYFLPYNNKIWKKPAKEMSPKWAEGKLPIPDKKSFFNSLLHSEDDKMPHSSFFYPNTNDQKTFIDALAADQDIILNYSVKKIERTGNQWKVNGDKIYDVLISTLPLDLITGLLTGTPVDVTNEAAKLKYNKVTTMLWETKGTQRTWTYVPDSSNLYHRYIHIGNFFTPAKNYSITEVIGEISYEEMVSNGLKDPFLERPIDYNVSEHAYVVFDENHEAATNAVKGYLQEIGLYTLGRFGEWEYYNMDICIKRSLDLSKLIHKIYSDS
jgi:protoporphyrinogen oxidase